LISPQSGDVRHSAVDGRVFQFLQVKHSGESFKDDRITLGRRRSTSRERQSNALNPPIGVATTAMVYLDKLFTSSLELFS
jgi:hypothetical protein